MKKGVFALFMVLVSVVIAFNTGCEEDPVEACEQDLFCDNTIEVTACCTDGTDCYYTYGEVDYPDTEEGLLDLLEAMDCVSKSSAKVDEESDYMMARLQAMLEEARINSKR